MMSRSIETHRPMSTNMNADRFESHVGPQDRKQRTDRKARIIQSQKEGLRRAVEQLSKLTSEQFEAIRKKFEAARELRKVREALSLVRAQGQNFVSKYEIMSGLINGAFNKKSAPNPSDLPQNIDSTQPSYKDAMKTTVRALASLGLMAGVAAIVSPAHEAQAQKPVITEENYIDVMKNITAEEMSLLTEEELNYWESRFQEYYKLNPPNDATPFDPAILPEGMRSPDDSMGNPDGEIHYAYFIEDDALPEIQAAAQKDPRLIISENDRVENEVSQYHELDHINLTIGANPDQVFQVFDIYKDTRDSFAIRDRIAADPEFRAILDSIGADIAVFVISSYSEETQLPMAPGEVTYQDGGRNPDSSLYVMTPNAFINTVNHSVGGHAKTHLLDGYHEEGYKHMDPNYETNIWTPTGGYTLPWHSTPNRTVPGTNLPLSDGVKDTETKARINSPTISDNRDNQVGRPIRMMESNFNLPEGEVTIDGFALNPFAELYYKKTDGSLEPIHINQDGTWQHVMYNDGFNPLQVIYENALITIFDPTAPQIKKLFLPFIQR